MFLHISRRALDVRKIDESENNHHNRTNIIDWYVCKNVNHVNKPPRA